MIAELTFHILSLLSKTKCVTMPVYVLLHGSLLIYFRSKGCCFSRSLCSYESLEDREL